MQNLKVVVGGPYPIYDVNGIRIKTASSGGYLVYPPNPLDGNFSVTAQQYYSAVPKPIYIEVLDDAVKLATSLKKG